MKVVLLTLPNKHNGNLPRVSALLGFCLLLLTGCAGNGPSSIYVPIAERPEAESGPDGAGVGAWRSSMPVGYRPPTGLRLGIDVLAANRFDLLWGKRVGLLCHIPSVAANGMHTRSILQRAAEVNLVALYTPEHGLDGRAKAGVKVRTTRDSMTGLTAYSLYGDTRKPTWQMLSGIDVLVVDLQDIGSRSYTYISTLALCMEACAESGKEMIVLDRPNPLGGMRVQGPPLEKRWTSFVGQLPVPYVHGLTMGEVAMMAHGRGWTRGRPRLQVVKMQGWDRRMAWEDTRLRWIRTSPNIPHASSSFDYAATGVFGGAYGIDIGIGTTRPFSYAGAKGISGTTLSRRMSAKGFHGIWFRPYSRNGFSGTRMTISKGSNADLLAVDLELLSEVNRMTGGSTIGRMTGDKLSLFNKVYGSDSLVRDLQRGRPVPDIVASWAPFHAKFKSDRRRYLLYPEPYQNLAQQSR